MYTILQIHAAWRRMRMKTLSGGGYGFGPTVAFREMEVAHVP